MSTISSKPDEELNVNRLFFSAIKKKSKIFFLGIFLTSFLDFICIVYLAQKISSDVIFYIIFLPWVLLTIWIAKIYLEADTFFWKQLALRYQWEYVDTKDLSQEKALLFNVGSSKYVQNGIVGNYKNQPFQIFEYSYTIGSGKNRTTYFFTVFEVKFTGTFPHLYLNYKSDWYSNAPSIFSSLAKISVPSEFGDKFKLYAPKEYEIETLEIFTPDVFALLIDSKWNHDMEFVDGELVIYTTSRFTNFTDLNTELNKIKKFVDILSPLLNKLKLTQIGDISASLVN